MKNEIILFENQDVKLEVNMKDDSVWLTQGQMAELFNTSRTNIIKHINNICYYYNRKLRRFQLF